MGFLDYFWKWYLKIFQFPKCSLLISRNTVNFCTLTLYPDTLPNSLMEVLFCFLHSPICRVLCIINASFFSPSLSSFPFQCLLFLFLILLHWLDLPVWRWKDIRHIPALSPILGVGIRSFTLKYVSSRFLEVAFPRPRKFPFIPRFLRVLNHEWMSDFVRFFSASIKMICTYFFFINFFFLTWWIT